MIYDDLHNPDGAGSDRDFQPAAAPSPAIGVPGAPAPDREVPLPTWPSSALLHRWLDGEVDMAAIRASTGGDETVDMWNRIHDEAETLRSRTTPLYVHKRIMESLPDDAYTLRQPWYRRGVSINPAVLLVAAAALVALGVAVAHVVIR